MQCCAGDVEEQQKNEEYVIENVVKSAVLTYAFRNPEKFRSVSSFSSIYLKSCAYDEMVECSITRNALLIHDEFNRRLAIAWFFFAFALSVFIGITGGVISHNPDLGLQIGTSVLGLLTALQYTIISRADCG